MLDAEPRNREAGDGAAGEERRAREPRLPVLAVLHQPHSTPGRVGLALRELGHALDVRRPRFGDPLPATLEDHAGAIIFGGPMSANDTEECVRIETEWLKVALGEKKPFLGICLGAQMLAKHLGARVWQHPERVEIGYCPIRWHGALAETAPPDRVYQWHREGFELPRGAAMLATSEGPFPNQAFGYGSAIGMQFHPEITYAMVNRWTNRNHERMAMPGAQDRVSQFEGHFVHAPAVHRWLARFLNEWLGGDRRYRTGDPAWLPTRSKCATP